MTKYRVKVHHDYDAILAHIQNRHNPEYQLLGSRDFESMEDAKIHATMVSLKTGKRCSIRTIDPNPDAPASVRLNNRFGVE